MTSPFARLANINLLTRDTARARAFYQGAFGLRMDERRSALPAMLILQASSVSLSLKDAATEEPSKLAGPGDVELGFETDELEAVQAAIVRLGGTVTPIIELGFGHTFDAQDPDGHHLVVYRLAKENR